MSGWNNFLATMGLAPSQAELTDGVEFWHGAERQGWLMKQGDVIKTWRRRWFVLKDGKLFWFLSEHVTPASHLPEQLALARPIESPNRPAAQRTQVRSPSM